MLTKKKKKKESCKKEVAFHSSFMSILVNKISVKQNLKKKRIEILLVRPNIYFRIQLSILFILFWGNQMFLKQTFHKQHIASINNLLYNGFNLFQ